MMQIAGALRSLRSGEGLKGQLLRGGLGSVALKMASTLLNVLMAVVLARILGTESFGVYSFVFAVVTIMAIPAQFGLPNLIVRETAKAQAEGRWDVMKGLWRWASLVTLGISLCLMVSSVLVAWLVSAHLSSAGLVTFYWGLALMPLVALGNLRGGALRGLRHVVQGQLPEFVLRPSFLIILVLTTHLGVSSRTLNASDAMMLHAVASLIAFAIGAVMLRRARPDELAAEPNSTVYFRPWIASAIPLGMVEGIHMLNRQIGIVLVGILTTANEVGLFRVAMQGAIIVAFGQAAVNAVLAPYIARLYAKNEIHRLQQMVTLSARAALVIAMIAIIGFALFGQEILEVLFGREYTAAYWPLLILTAGQFASVFAGSVGVLLNMTGHERDVVIGHATGLVSTVLLTLALTSAFGIMGAAFATATSLVIWNALLWWRVRARLRIDSSPMQLNV